ncbi:sensor domain-containing diguanylate cyclase [Clostridiisalibacter paucivorans]|uniref:sensor domain-containing diguanylate cyclase n=1 Tax=Clostridiisalibacter paucivorans TaxID=408753 RepID=UPI000686F8ED|nr:sensor domain-containing diguanylate cyclase [Clostridiisalibacter paucivorans]
MDNIKEDIYKKNINILKLLWIVALVSGIINVFVHKDLMIINQHIEFLFCAILSVLIIKKNWAIKAMYLTITIISIYVFILILNFPYLINFVLLWMILIISSFYQNYKAIILASIYTLFICLYTFLKFRSLISTNISNIDIIYFISFTIYLIMFLSCSIKINKNLKINALNSQPQLENVLKEAHIATVTYDLSAKHIESSKGFEKLVGIDINGYLINNIPWQNIVHEKDHYIIYDSINKLLNKNILNVEFRIKHPKSGIKWVQVRINILKNQYNSINKLNAVFIDITSRKRLEVKVKHMAYHDILTGLPNRARMNEHLKYLINDCKSKISLMLLDLDNFKYINDNEGHNFGDLVLINASKRLQNILRDSDFICRFGGDEFIIVLKNAGIEEGTRIANRIIDEFSLPITVHDKEVYLTTSIGISTYPDDSNKIESLIKMADMAMYSCKNSGKNSYSFYKDLLNNNNEKRDWI